MYMHVYVCICMYLGRMLSERIEMCWYMQYMRIHAICALYMHFVCMSVLAGYACICVYLSSFCQYSGVYTRKVPWNCTASETISTIAKRTGTRLEYPETSFTSHFSAGIVVNQPKHGPGVDAEERAFWQPSWLIQQPSSSEREHPWPHLKGAACRNQTHVSKMQAVTLPSCANYATDP